MERFEKLLMFEISEEDEMEETCDKTNGGFDNIVEKAIRQSEDKIKTLKSELEEKSRILERMRSKVISSRSSFKINGSSVPIVLKECFVLLEDIGAKAGRKEKDLRADPKNLTTKSTTNDDEISLGRSVDSDAHSCQFCKEQFQSEIDILLHFREEHVDNEDIESSGSSSLEDFIDGNDEKGRDENFEDFLTDAEINLRQNLELSKTSQVGDELSFKKNDLNEASFQEKWDDNFPSGDGDKIESEEKLEWFDFEKLKDLASAENDRLEPILDKVIAQRRRYLCGCCDCSFSRLTKLKKHIKATHNSKPKAEVNLDTRDRSGLENSGQFRCNLCQKSFAFSTHLKRHKIIVHRPKNFPCVHCNRRFKTHYHLTLHKKQVHSYLRPFLCQFCFQRFYRKNNLTWHIRRIHRRSNKSFI